MLRLVGRRPDARWSSPTRAGGPRATPPGRAAARRGPSRGSRPPAIARRLALAGRGAAGAAGVRRRAARAGARHRGADDRSALHPGGARRRRLRLLRLGLRRAAAPPHWRSRAPCCTSAAAPAATTPASGGAPPPRSTSDPRASALREALAAAGADAWLLFAFHGLNPGRHPDPRARRDSTPAGCSCCCRARASRSRWRTGSSWHRWPGFPAGCCPTAAGRSCTRRWARSWRAGGWRWRSPPRMRCPTSTGCPPAWSS